MKKALGLLAGPSPTSTLMGSAAKSSRMSLLDLLIEHEIGLQKKPAVLYEVDERYFDEGG